MDNPVTHLAEVSVDAEIDRAAFDQLPEPALVVDENTLIVRVNTEAEIFLGYTRLQLLGQPIEVLVPETKRPIHTDHVARYKVYPQTKQMASRHEDLMVRTKRGSEIPCRISLKPFTVPSGRYFGVLIRLKHETRGEP